jgi:dTDP-4-dehydrorhamnose 3,5-epimerase
MKILNTPLKGAYIIEPAPFQDHRGMFARIFCKKELGAIGHNQEVVQINHSINLKRGALRGMHFQNPPRAEIKFVKCIRGGVYDVIIDLRKNSPTFLQWYGINITTNNMRMMYIPEGFAHGFQTLEPHSELLYFHTEFFSPDWEGAIRFDDPRVGIRWPLEIAEISDRDKGHPLLDEAFKGLDVSL